MFDRVYPDLMTLFKSTELNQSALDMNTQYEVLLEFFNVHKHTPKYTPDSRSLVFRVSLHCMMLLVSWITDWQKKYIKIVIDPFCSLRSLKLPKQYYCRCDGNILDDKYEWHTQIILLVRSITKNCIVVICQTCCSKACLCAVQLTDRSEFCRRWHHAA